MKRLMNWRLVSLFTMMTLILTGCGKEYLSPLKPAGEVAQMQYDLMKLSTVIMIGVIIAVTIIFVIVVTRFRRKDDKIPKQVEGSHTLEMIWTVIPILLLLILAIPTVSATFKLADVKEMDKKNEEGNRDALVVNVRANLYWWEFEYPDLGIITGQELVVPTNEKVYFSVKSSDVKHSFWIPAVGGKIDTNTDTINKFWLEFDDAAANKANNLFYGKCAELCGPAHAFMDFKVNAISKEEFSKWVSAMQNAKDPQPTSDLAKEGQEIFNQSCISCHAVTPQDGKPEAARLAPNLANFGERTRIAGILDHDEENLKSWLANPETHKPGNKMSNSYNQLTEEQLDALSEYLMNLKVMD